MAASYWRAGDGDPRYLTAHVTILVGVIKMRKPPSSVVAVVLLVSLAVILADWNAFATTPPSLVRLPRARSKGTMSVEEALSRRRSVRTFGRGALSLEGVSQILWAAQGITSERGFRTAPSAGALYPLEVYLVASQVEGLEAGLYRYKPSQHALEMLRAGDLRKDLARAALRQGAISDAAANLVITAVYERTARRYGARAERYVRIEVGHVGQNVYLQVEALELGTVAIGAFHDESVKRLLGVEEDPLYIMPIGKLWR